MRTLLIDNYDSFTFNVAQAIAGVNGEEPVIVKNDELSVAELLDLNFDNIVISPGPGSPVNDRDFGICGEVIERATCPILGICMGFQGIALLSGASVVPSPEPWHGRGSFVTHDGTGLFEGIPSPFFGIRYHSLHVPSLEGTDLVVTARTDDGMLMAFAHARRPIWGVQFHPESVATEYGSRIFENFRDLSLREAAPSVRNLVANLKPVDVLPDSERKELPVRSKRLADAPPAELVFASVYGEQESAVWLDSNAVLSGRSRFSFMADASGPGDHLLRYRSRGRKLEIVSHSGSEIVTESIFDYLKSSLRSVRADSSSLPFDFCGGYIGYLGYELKGECGGEYQYESDLPDAFYLRVSRFLAFDHANGDCYVVAVGGHPDDGDDRDEGDRHDGDATLWIADTVARIEQLDTEPPGVREPRKGHVTEPPGVREPRKGHVTEPPGVREPRKGHVAHRFQLEQDKAQYLEHIDIALERIRAGESYQVCLTNRARTEFDGDAFGLYQTLRQRNPAPFSAFLKCEAFSILCSSPERFLRILPDGVVESRPIKGTMNRSSDPVEDVRLREELLHSEKNRSENLMIADLLRNDLGRTAQIGTVQVPSLMAVESYETVHHLVSTVQSQLAESRDALDCIRSAFPGGSMTGAPKIRTMEIIDRLESSARGVYSGALGYLSYSGAVDLNIVIRTMVVAGGAISVGMGGGVVALSDPQEEFDEALLKARALMDAVADHCRSDVGTAHSVGEE
jgi:para-aminobenzoate synthetase